MTRDEQIADAVRKATFVLLSTLTEEMDVFMASLPEWHPMNAMRFSSRRRDALVALDKALSLVLGEVPA